MALTSGIGRQECDDAMSLVPFDGERRCICPCESFFKTRRRKSSPQRDLRCCYGFLGVFAVWAYASVRLLALQALPQSVVTILAILVTGKAIQRFGEK